jgi:hypothetical protein
VNGRLCETVFIFNRSIKKSGAAAGLSLSARCCTAKAKVAAGAALALTASRVINKSMADAYERERGKERKRENFEN